MAWTPRPTYAMCWRVLQTTPPSSSAPCCHGTGPHSTPPLKPPDQAATHRALTLRRHRREDLPAAAVALAHGAAGEGRGPVVAISQLRMSGIVTIASRVERTTTPATSSGWLFQRC